MPGRACRNGVIDPAAELLGQDSLLAIWSTMSRRHRAEPLTITWMSTHIRGTTAIAKHSVTRILATAFLPGAPRWWG